VDQLPAARAWADLAEAHNQSLFEAVLDAAGVGPGTRVLDVGCGSGLTLVLAARRDARPSGLDISPGLLGIARERLPDAELRDGDMESLPFGDASFDAVVGVNAFQFAGDPRRALPDRADDHAPYALSAPGNLEAAMADAALRIVNTGEVVCCWRYASMDDAVGGLLCSAGGARAAEAAGQEAVRDVLQRTLAQFQDPQTGVVTLRNTFRWVAAQR
jgi:SAM-dependent methyltransferase